MTPSLMLALVNAILGPGFTSSSPFEPPQATTLAMTARAMINAWNPTLARSAALGRARWLITIDSYCRISTELAGIPAPATRSVKQHLLRDRLSRLAFHLTDTFGRSPCRHRQGIRESDDPVVASQTSDTLRSELSWAVRGSWLAHLYATSCVPVPAIRRVDSADQFPCDR